MIPVLLPIITSIAILLYFICSHQFTLLSVANPRHFIHITFSYVRSDVMQIVASDLSIQHIKQFCGKKYKIHLQLSHTFGLVWCGRCEIAIRKRAGGEVIMCEDFLDNHPTFPGNLDIPLGSCSLHSFANRQTGSFMTRCVMC